MDNLDNGEAMDPQGTADVSAPSGQSEEIETQPVEGTETDVVEGEQAGTEEASSNPWDSDDRFKGKSPEEMFKIVQEADRYKGELGQKAKVADMLSQQFGLTPERMEQIAHERAMSQRQQQIANDPVAAVYDKVQQLETQLQVKEEENKLNAFLSANPQYADFADEIKDLGFSVDRDKSWEQIAEKYFGRAIQKGQESAYKQINIKQNTQATGVSRGDIKPSVTLEDMQNMTAAELEAVLKARQ